MGTMYTDLSLPPSGSKVLLAMSGGVDSCVAALILRDAGCRITGVTMTMGSPSCSDAGTVPPGNKDGSDSVIASDSEATSEGDGVAAARDLCRYLGIPHIVADVTAEYRAHVLNYFTAAYRAGLTPNPCIECNSNVKFGAMIAKAGRISALFHPAHIGEDAPADWDYFCTGHYARVVQYNDTALAAIARDTTKDQSYFLCRIPNSTMERVRFPLGGMTKAEVKQVARSVGLAAADRPESQDFLPDAARLSLFACNPPPPGDIVDADGNILGRHNGLHRYTVGQRRGLGVAAGRPLYVVRLDAKTNTVVLGDEADLLQSTLTAVNAVWHVPVPSEPIEAMVKVRGRTPAVPATVEAASPADVACPSFTVHFHAPVRAIARGQQAVVYVDGAVWGAGVIDGW